MRLHHRNGAGSGLRLVRNVRHQHGRLRARPGGDHLMSADRIRELNDQLRTTLDPRFGQVLMTAGVNALPPGVKATVIEHVRTFSDFNEDNDPHQEHDFGNFSLVGHKFFWKIDAYDTEMQYGSPDPADPAKTT